jgi:hypothetical protein
MMQVTSVFKSQGFLVLYCWGNPECINSFLAESFFFGVQEIEETTAFCVTNVKYVIAPYIEWLWIC